MCLLVSISRATNSELIKMFYLLNVKIDLYGKQEIFQEVFRNFFRKFSGIM